MSSVLVQLMYFTASYAGLILFLFAVLNWLTKGFLWSYIRVKPSKGKRVLIYASTETDLYVTYGTKEGSSLKYKTRDGQKLKYPRLERGDSYPAMGVWAVDIDEVNRKIVNKVSGSMSEIDPYDVDSLVTQAIESPKSEDMREKLVNFALFMISLGVLIILLVLYNMFKKIDLILEVLSNAGVV